MKLELFDLAGQPVDVGLDLIGRPGVPLFGGQIEQLRRIAQRALEPVQSADDLLEPGALLAQILGALRVVPNTGLFELALYFLEPFVSVVVIKDTSSKSRRAPRDL